MIKDEKRFLRFILALFSTVKFNFNPLKTNFTTMERTIPENFPASEYDNVIFGLTIKSRVETSKVIKRIEVFISNYIFPNHNWMMKRTESITSRRTSSGSYVFEIRIVYTDALTNYLPMFFVEVIEGSETQVKIFLPKSTPGVEMGGKMVKWPYKYIDDLRNFLAKPLAEEKSSDSLTISISDRLFADPFASLFGGYMGTTLTIGSGSKTAKTPEYYTFNHGDVHNAFAKGEPMRILPELKVSFKQILIIFLLAIIVRLFIF
jgi:hypothetical protein